MIKNQLLIIGLGDILLYQVAEVVWGEGGDESDAAGQVTSLRLTLLSLSEGSPSNPCVNQSFKKQHPSLLLIGKI